MAFVQRRGESGFFSKRQNRNIFPKYTNNSRCQLKRMPTSVSNLLYLILSVDKCLNYIPDVHTIWVLDLMSNIENQSNSSVETAIQMSREIY